MELNDVVQRIFRAHRGLLVLFLLAGLAVPAVLHSNDSPRYAAHVRLTLDVPDPQSAAESTAVADAARAIVTSPGRVEEAIAETNLSRDPVTTAEENIAIEALGTSGIQRLTVTDRDPDAAAALANALADGVIETRQSARGVLAEATAELDALARNLDADIARVDAEINELVASGGPAAVDRLRVIRNRREDLAQRRAEVDRQQQQAFAADALRPKASIIDRAAAPEEAEPSRAPADIALGGLLGLLLGLGAAALLESLRPKVVGAGAIARSLGTHSLGELPIRPDLVESKHLNGLCRRVSLAASGAGVTAIEMMAAGPPVALNRLADEIDDGVVRELTAEGWNPREVPPAPPRGTFTRALHTTLRPERIVYTLDDPTSRGSAGRGYKAGIIAVVPEIVRRSDLDVVDDLRRLSGWPLLGTITYRRRSRQQPDKRPSHAAAGRRNAPTATQQPVRTQTQTIQTTREHAR